MSPPNDDEKRKKLPRIRCTNNKDKNSEGELDGCIICLSSFKTQQIGSPECCDHAFCFICIKEWAKQVNTCPVDRLPFSLILVRNSLNEEVKEMISVSPRGQFESVMLPCELCQHPEIRDHMIQCSICRLVFHPICGGIMSCRFVERQWYCRDCYNQQILELDSEVTSDIMFPAQSLIRSEAPPLMKPSHHIPLVSPAISIGHSLSPDSIHPSGGYYLDHPSSPEPNTDVLGSILESQMFLHMNSQNIHIHSDGTLKLRSHFKQCPQSPTSSSASTPPSSPSSSNSPPPKSPTSNPRYSFGGTGGSLPNTEGSSSFMLENNTFNFKESLGIRNNGAERAGEEDVDIYSDIESVNGEEEEEEDHASKSASMSKIDPSKFNAPSDDSDENDLVIDEDAKGEEKSPPQCIASPDPPSDTEELENNPPTLVVDKKELPHSIDSIVNNNKDHGNGKFYSSVSVYNHEHNSYDHLSYLDKHPFSTSMCDDSLSNDRDLQSKANFCSSTNYESISSGNSNASLSNDNKCTMYNMKTETYLPVSQNANIDYGDFISAEDSSNFSKTILGCSSSKSTEDDECIDVENIHSPTVTLFNKASEAVPYSETYSEEPAAKNNDEEIEEDSNNSDPQSTSSFLSLVKDEEENAQNESNSNTVNHASTPPSYSNNNSNLAASPPVTQNLVMEDCEEPFEQPTETDGVGTSEEEKKEDDFNDVDMEPKIIEEEEDDDDNKVITIEDDDREEGEIIDDDVKIISPTKAKKKPCKKHHKESRSHEHHKKGRKDNKNAGSDSGDAKDMAAGAFEMKGYDKLSLGDSCDSNVGWKRLSKSNKGRSYRDGKPKDDQLLFQVRDLKRKRGKIPSQAEEPRKKKAKCQHHSKRNKKSTKRERSASRTPSRNHRSRSRNTENIRVWPFDTSPTQQRSYDRPSSKNCSYSRRSRSRSFGRNRSRRSRSRNKSLDRGYGRSKSRSRSRGRTRVKGSLNESPNKKKTSKQGEASRSRSHDKLYKSKSRRSRSRHRSRSKHRSKPKPNQRVHGIEAADISKQVNKKPKRFNGSNKDASATLEANNSGEILAIKKLISSTNKVDKKAKIKKKKKKHVCHEHAKKKSATDCNSKTSLDKHEPSTKCDQYTETLESNPDNNQNGSDNSEKSPTSASKEIYAKGNSIIINLNFKNSKKEHEIKPPLDIFATMDDEDSLLEPNTAASEAPPIPKVKEEPEAPKLVSPKVAPPHEQLYWEENLLEEPYSKLKPQDSTDSQEATENQDVNIDKVLGSPGNDEDSYDPCVPTSSPLCEVEEISNPSPSSPDILPSTISPTQQQQSNLSTALSLLPNALALLAQLKPSLLPTPSKFIGGPPLQAVLPGNPPLPPDLEPTPRKEKSRAHKNSNSSLSKFKNFDSEFSKMLQLDASDKEYNLDSSKDASSDKLAKEKFIKKLNRQERAIEEVKLVLKPFYSKRTITKDEYKEILRKSVPKICHNKSGEINPFKIKLLVEGYVKKFKYLRKKYLREDNNS